MNTPNTPLRQQMQRAMEIRGLALKTQKAYIIAVKGLARYYNRSPATLTEDEVQQYLYHLINERKLSWSTTNQAACAFKFLFHNTLKQREAAFTIPLRKVSPKLPEILSREEIERLLASCHNIQHRVLIMVVYACGLRASEVCRLRVSDIDSERMMLRVSQGKGGKDRMTLLTPNYLMSCASIGARIAPKNGCFLLHLACAPSRSSKRSASTMPPNVVPT